MKGAVRNFRELARNAWPLMEHVAPADEILDFVTSSHAGLPFASEGHGSPNVRSPVPQLCAQSRKGIENGFAAI